METYPDEPPVFEITESDNIEEDQIQELLDLMTQQVFVYSCHTDFNPSSTNHKYNKWQMKKVEVASTALLDLLVRLVIRKLRV